MEDLAPRKNYSVTKQAFRTSVLNHSTFSFRVTRRDMESMLGRFWLFADTRINLIPLDESEPRLGGRVLATQTTVDFSTLTL